VALRALFSVNLANPLSNLLSNTLLIDLIYILDNY